jgi:oligoendopeptidase F
MEWKSFNREDFDLQTFDEVKPLFDELIGREIKNDNEFRNLLADYNRLLKWVYECGARLRLAADREMSAENTEKALAFTRNVLTVMASADNQLKSKIFELGKEHDPAIPGYSAHRNRLALNLKLFRQENVELQKQLH